MPAEPRPRGRGHQAQVENSWQAHRPRSLKQNLQSELRFPRCIRLGADDAEVCRGRAGIRSAELNAIERIEELCAELHPDIFAREKLLEYGKIRVVHIRRAEIAYIRAQVPECEWSRLAEYARVEVLIQPVVYIARKDWRFPVAVRPFGRIPKSRDITRRDLQRSTALNRGDSVDLPITQNPVHRLRRVGAELPAAAEWQIVNITNYQPLRDVVTGNCPIRQNIVTVLVITSVVQYLGPGV